MLAKNNKLVREWNAFVPRYNAVVRPRAPGRPLEASETQIADVLKRRKAGASLRTIVAATGLGLSTVRSILKGNERAKDLRKREFDRQRALAFRSRKRMVDRVPAQKLNL